MSPQKKPVLVIGAGIVGLSVARQLLLENPDTPVCLLEKEGGPGVHQTGHNSGVIHSGIYYPPASEKAVLCREGIHLLHEFCDRNGIPRKVCGKLIVATRKEEFQELEKLHQWGKAHGIQGLREISGSEIRELEPSVRGLKALHLPDVALVDFQKVALALQAEVEAGGGSIRFHEKVRALSFRPDGVTVETEREAYEGSYVVNCAGLYCDRIARLAGCELPAHIIPFRGEYHLLSERWKNRIRHLIYPTPDPRLPFLGVHLTPTLKGDILAGPNAILALAREGYSWKTLHGREFWEMCRLGSFWRMVGRYWKTGVQEMGQTFFKPLYLAQLKKLVPGISLWDLIPDGAGVRAQAVDRNGCLVHDFLYVQQKDALHIVNAPSPAATACLAIAKRVAKLIPRP